MSCRLVVSTSNSRNFVSLFNELVKIRKKQREMTRDEKKGQEKKAHFFYVDMEE